MPVDRSYAASIYLHQADALDEALMDMSEKLALDLGYAKEMG